MPSPDPAVSPEKVNIADKLARFSDHFQPKIVGELNGQHVKLVKFQGEFVWHSHDAEDEMFLVLKGAFDMQFRDRTVRIGEGEFLVVPRGVEHCPKAEAEVSLMLFEPAGTLNTGDAGPSRGTAARAAANALRPEAAPSRSGTSSGQTGSRARGTAPPCRAASAGASRP
jgi:mannose-6-phosphate isomerase-like protein (cupin superfamily)